EIEKALFTIVRIPIELTGSSRTDAGVHALQNYFHFDVEKELHAGLLYNLNAVLPGDIAVRKLIPMQPEAHSRFDAVSREYRYHIYRKKDPFYRDRGYYFPYQLDLDRMREAAAILHEYRDFTSFSKRNTQVKTFICTLERSEWIMGPGDDLQYYV